MALIAYGTMPEPTPQTLERADVEAQTEETAPPETNEEN